MSKDDNGSNGNPKFAMIDGRPARDDEELSNQEIKEFQPQILTPNERIFGGLLNGEALRSSIHNNILDFELDGGGMINPESTAAIVLEQAIQNGINASSRNFNRNRYLLNSESENISIESDYSAGVNGHFNSEEARFFATVEGNREKLKAKENKLGRDPGFKRNFTDRVVNYTLEKIILEKLKETKQEREERTSKKGLVGVYNRAQIALEDARYDLGEEYTSRKGLNLVMQSIEKDFRETRFGAFIESIPERIEEYKARRREESRSRVQLGGAAENYEVNGETQASGGPEPRKSLSERWGEFRENHPFIAGKSRIGGSALVGVGLTALILGVMYGSEVLNRSLQKSAKLDDKELSCEVYSNGIGCEANNGTYVTNLFETSNGNWLLKVEEGGKIIIDEELSRNQINAYTTHLEGLKDEKGRKFFSPLVEAHSRYSN